MHHDRIIQNTSPQIKYKMDVLFMIIDSFLNGKIHLEYFNRITF